MKPDINDSIDTFISMLKTSKDVKNISEKDNKAIDDMMISLDKIKQLSTLSAEEANIEVIKIMEELKKSQE